MTFKIKMLAATAFIAFPLAASAQDVPPSGQQPASSATQTAQQTQQQVNPAAANAQATPDETVRETEEAPNQAVDSETGVPPVAQTAPVPAEQPALPGEAVNTETTPPVPAPTEQQAPTPAEIDRSVPPASSPPGDLTTTAPTAQTTPPATAPATAPAAQPAQTTAQAQTTAAPGPVVLATAADLQAGAQVHDATGGVVGTVESADADSAVVSTGTIRAEIPLRSFGKNNRGLVISVTRAQLEAAARAQSPG